MFKLRPSLILGVLLVLLASLTGCVSTLASHEVADNKIRSEKEFTLLGPVHVPVGAEPEGCGAQALAAAAQYVDPSINADALCNELPWGQSGATAPEILIAARKRGLVAKLSEGTWDSLEKSVQENHPMLVLIDGRAEVKPTLIGDSRSGLRQYHWAVVSGFSAQQHRVLLAAPKDEHLELDQDDFVMRWNETKNCAIEISSSKGASQ